MSFDVAVVVPAFNRARFLPATLDSILNQEFAPSEVVVVDDGSTDDTPAVVSAFSSRVKYVRIENSGVCRARNVGVWATSSEWLTFCDSDDLWSPRKLAEQVALAKAAPGVEFQFCDFVRVIDDRWEDLPKFGQAPPGYWEPGRHMIGDAGWRYSSPLYPRVLEFQPVFQSNTMMSRAFFERIGAYDESLGRMKSEDLEFTLRCVQEAPVAALAKPLVGIRRHPGNFSGDQLRVLLGELEILRFALAHHRDAGLYREAIERQLELRSRQAADAAFAAAEFPITSQALRQVPFSHRSLKLHLKAVISSLPLPLARRFHALLGGSS